MPANTLPVLIISAKELTQAKQLAAELINNQKDTEVSEVQENSVWQLQNKYYSANVRIHPVGDSDVVENDVLSLAEAHIIYITKEESDIVALAQKRAATVKDADAVDVSLILYEGSKAPSVLSTWACDNHYEVVPLEETESSQSDGEEIPDEDRPFKETYGVERARDTLHAHTWTGLQRLDMPGQLQSFEGLTLSSEDEWVGGENEEEELNEEQMVERAEAFAMALESVLHAQAARGEGDDDSRRRRAEGAVNALRRALGPDFDWL